MRILEAGYAFADGKSSDRSRDEHPRFDRDCGTPDRDRTVCGTHAIWRVCSLPSVDETLISAQR